MKMPCPCELRGCVHFKGMLEPEEGLEYGKDHCDAFPKGIPVAILTMEHDHTTPFEGDHGIQFEEDTNRSTQAKAVAAEELQMLKQLGIAKKQRAKTKSTTVNYDPSQPRDDIGRWSEGGFQRAP